MARLKFRPEDGLHVTVRGSLSVYEMRGEYQIYVEHVEPVGLGALQLAFDQLKKRLEAEGPVPSRAQKAAADAAAVRGADHLTQGRGGARRRAAFCGAAFRTCT